MDAENSTYGNGSEESDERPVELSREIELDSGPEEAWRALSEEDGLAAWLGEDVEADLEPGGAIRVRDGDGTELDGFIEAIEPERNLTFWWSARGEESSRVVLELEPAVAGGCVVRVTETRPLRALERELAEITGMFALP